MPGGPLCRHKTKTFGTEIIIVQEDKRSPQVLPFLLCVENLYYQPTPC